MRDIAGAIQRRDAAALASMANSKVRDVKADRHAETAKIFNQFFVQLRAAFPAMMATLKSQEDVDELKRQYLLAFKENGIHDMAQISHGMSIARQQTSPFAPSPGQFVAWCLSGDDKRLGLPSQNELYRLVMHFAQEKYRYNSAAEYPWPTAACYWMVTRLYDAMRSRNLGESELRLFCADELRCMAKRIRAGEVIPEPVPLVEKKYIPVSQKEGLERVKELRMMLKGKRK